MRRLLVFLWLAAAAAGAGATGIPSYLVHLDAAADGTGQVRLQVRIDEAGVGPLLVPLSVSLRPDGPVQIERAPLGTKVRTVDVGDRPHLELMVPEGTERSFDVEARFAAKGVITPPRERERGKKAALPPHSFKLEHAFVNTQPATIGSYRVKVMLPDGQRVHKVIEQTPRTRRTEVEPRVALNGNDGRQGAVLQLKDLKTGDRTVMSLELVKDHRPLNWLIVGSVLAIAYLIGFRDMVRKPQTGDAAGAAIR